MVMLTVHKTRIQEQVFRNQSSHSPPQHLPLLYATFISQFFSNTVKTLALIDRTWLLCLPESRMVFPKFSFSPTYKLKRSIKFITSSIKTIPEIKDCIYYMAVLMLLIFPRTISLFFALFIDH